MWEAPKHISKFIMKFQIVFLSLFLAAAHARHEPKGKGLRGGDDRDLELVGSTVVPNGSSATINCGSGSQCCVTGSFKTINNVGSTEAHQQVHHEVPNCFPVTLLGRSSR
mmetsp:Transcript_10400/g.20812  ORF Transcript_10400/g.20812 Transcript_10400/m.20812 type:complete len:110 (-) Transcript_10400:165-494(-)